MGKAWYHQFFLVRLHPNTIIHHTIASLISSPEDIVGKLVVTIFTTSFSIFFINVKTHQVPKVIIHNL